ncbi:MAG: cyclodeaminase/cyclohydrolase family protein [Verrucomicrobiota bacterium]
MTETPLAAGPAIVRTLELAAGLALLTARVAGRNDLVTRAEELLAELAPLGAADADAYRDFLATHSAEARARTVELPLRMAELAADTAELAAEAAFATDSAARGDARAGVLLAEAGARAAAMLVQVNGGGGAAASATGRAARAAARL